MLLVGIASYAALGLQRWGFRSVEILVGCFVGVITVSYFMELVIAQPHWGRCRGWCARPASGWVGQH